MPLHTVLGAPGPKGIAGSTGTKTTPITTVHSFGVPFCPDGKDTKYIDGFESEVAQQLAFGSISSRYLGEEVLARGCLAHWQTVIGQDMDIFMIMSLGERPQSFCWGRVQFMRERFVEDARGEY